MNNPSIIRYILRNSREWAFAQCPLCFGIFLEIFQVSDKDELVFCTGKCNIDSSIIRKIQGRTVCPCRAINHDLRLVSLESIDGVDGKIQCFPFLLMLLPRIMQKLVLSAVRRDDGHLMSGQFLAYPLQNLRYKLDFSFVDDAATASALIFPFVVLCIVGTVVHDQIACSEKSWTGFGSCTVFQLSVIEQPADQCADNSGHTVLGFQHSAVGFRSALIQPLKEADVEQFMFQQLAIFQLNLVRIKQRRINNRREAVCDRRSAPASWREEQELESRPVGLYQPRLQ